MSVQELSQVIRYEIEAKPFLSRIHASVQAVTKEKGCLAGGAMITTMSISSFAGAIFTWLCMEGSVRSVIDVIEDPRWIVRLRYLGDIGGWTSLAVFSTVAVKGIFDKLMGEGNYIKIKELCRDWCLENRELIEQKPKLHDKLYVKLYEIFDSIHSSCLFSKSLTSRRLLALNICRESGLQEIGPELILDRKLEAVYEEIQKELDEELSTKKYCRRCCLGQREIKKKGSCSLSVSRIFGIVFPIILIVNFTLSLIGEVGLCKEIFGDREELTDIGHVGEWPINALEALATAYLFNLWYIISVGNVEKTKSIFAEHIDALKDDEPAIHNRLCQVAKEELTHASRAYHYLQLPIDNELEELTDNLENITL